MGVKSGGLFLFLMPFYAIAGSCGEEKVEDEPGNRTRSDFWRSLSFHCYGSVLGCQPPAKTLDPIPPDSCGRNVLGPTKVMTSYFSAPKRKEKEGGEKKIAKDEASGEN